MTNGLWQASVQQGVAGAVQDVSVSLSGLGTISAGDILLVKCHAVAATATTSWTQQAGPTFDKSAGKGAENTASASAYLVATHVCDGSESGTVTFRRSTTANNAVMQIDRYTGIDTTTPVQAVGSATGSGTTCVLPDLTSANADTLEVEFVSFQSVTAGVTWTPPAGATTRFGGQATGQGVAIVLGTEVVGSGATGTKTWTHTTSTATKGLAILLNPAAAPPTIPMTSVMVGGVEKDLASASVMVGGVEKALASASVMIGGVEKPST